MLLASGKTAAISSLKTGDKVKAVDTKTGKSQVKQVAAVLVHYDTDLYNLTMESGGHTEVIHTTSNHLFWDPSLNKFLPASNLKPGTHLQTPDGQLAVVVGGSAPAVHDGWMWDLTVPGNNDHDFYVAVAATAVLVHNIDCERVAQQTLGPNSGSGVSLERGDSFTQEEQQLINESGDANGCSTCDATKSGWKDGHWTVDHQPPNKLAPEARGRVTPNALRALGSKAESSVQSCKKYMISLLSYRSEIHEAWFFRGAIFVRAACDRRPRKHGRSWRLGPGIGDGARFG